jgi:hypothetical protein
MFLYTRDSLFIFSCLLYLGNRFLLKSFLPDEEVFFHNYFNDLLLIPCALPPALLIDRLLFIRSLDGFPSFKEILIHLITWSLLFEWVGPIFIKNATSDLGDVFSYWVGGVVSWVLWNRKLVIPNTRSNNAHASDPVKRLSVKCSRGSAAGDGQR